MEVKDLPIKNNTLWVLESAGITDTKTLLEMSEEEILKIPGVNDKIFRDILECTYCMDCIRSVYNSRLCNLNRLHAGRFVAVDKEGFSCPRKMKV